MPKNAGPLLRGITAFAGAEVIDITTAKAIAIVKGEEYGLQDLTADTLFAMRGSAPWFKGMVTPEVKKKAEKELLARGWTQDQINAPRQFGKEMPTQILRMPPAGAGKPQGASLLTPAEIQAELSRAGFGGPSGPQAVPGRISGGLPGEAPNRSSGWESPSGFSAGRGGESDHRTGAQNRSLGFRVGSGSKRGSRIREAECWHAASGRWQSRRSKSG